MTTAASTIQGAKRFIFIGVTSPLVDVTWPEPARAYDLLFATRSPWCRHGLDDRLRLRELELARVARLERASLLERGLRLRFGRLEHHGRRHCERVTEGVCLGG